MNSVPGVMYSHDHSPSSSLHSLVPGTLKSARLNVVPPLQAKNCPPTIGAFALPLLVGEYPTMFADSIPNTTAPLLDRVVSFRAKTGPIVRFGKHSKELVVL